LRIPTEQGPQQLAERDQTGAQGGSNRALNALNFLGPEFTGVLLNFRPLNASHDFFLFMLRRNIS
jgi:hypothetical protein